MSEFWARKRLQIIRWMWLFNSNNSHFTIVISSFTRLNNNLREIFHLVQPNFTRVLPQGARARATISSHHPICRNLTLKCTTICPNITSQLSWGPNYPYTLMQRSHPWSRSQSLTTILTIILTLTFNKSIIHLISLKYQTAIKIRWKI